MKVNKKNQSNRTISNAIILLHVCSLRKISYIFLSCIRIQNIFTWYSSFCTLSILFASQTWQIIHIYRQAKHMLHWFDIVHEWKCNTPDKYVVRRLENVTILFFSFIYRNNSFIHLWRWTSKTFLCWPC